MSRWLSSFVIAVALGMTVSTQGNRPVASSIGRTTLLHAHNCYPDRGQWADRIDRALATGLSPIAIEQDVAWTPAGDGREGRSVVVHDPPPVGDEPTLEQYFFERMRPAMERALRDGRRDSWPLVVLHLDFKTNEREHHQFIWRLLKRHESWLTTAPRHADTRPQALQIGPLLVLTENGDGQERVFHDEVPVGSRLLLFGTVPPTATSLPSDLAQRAAAVVRLPVSSLIPSSATNYRRWTNHSWAAIEEGGQAHAGPWTADDDRRLRALVYRAHEQGLWIRFYTLNGHLAEDGRGWSEGYNFGSQASADTRWRAAIAAGVDFVATDQYEPFAALLKETR